MVVTYNITHNTCDHEILSLNRDRLSWLWSCEVTAFSGRTFVPIESKDYLLMEKHANSCLAWSSFFLRIKKNNLNAITNTHKRKVQHSDTNSAKFSQACQESNFSAATRLEYIMFTISIETSLQKESICDRCHDLGSRHWNSLILRFEFLLAKNTYFCSK